MSWTDVHTHINMLELSADEALSAAQTNDVTKMITIGTCEEDLPTVLEIARKYSSRVGCALGIHPHEAGQFNPQIEAFIRKEAVTPAVVAIGETGLDYYRNETPVDVQIASFRGQMQIAKDLGLPVEIHTRDAEDDTKVILKDFARDNVGLLHCFTGTWDLAKAGLDCGFNISISGVVTFKNADALRDVVRKVPLERLHVETDAPFLAPVPHRGKKNHPAWMVHTAEVVADLKGISLEALQEATQENARRLFPKLQI